jgi:hypothetical protein
LRVCVANYNYFSFTSTLVMPTACLLLSLTH